MSTCLDIVTRALVKCRVLGAGRTPKAQDAADGLSALQELVDHLSGYGAAHPWLDEYEDGAVTVTRDQPGYRLHAKTSVAAFTITLPECPRDGARFGVIDADATFNTKNLTIDSDGVLFDATLTNAGEPTGGSRSTTVLSTQNLRRSWMYRADLGAWIRISDLTLAGAFPYPAEFDRSWRYMLAVELASDYGVELERPDYITAQHGFSRLAARYVEPLPVAIDGMLLNGLAMGRLRA
mgnify:CR=1 FL=1